MCGRCVRALNERVSMESLYFIGDGRGRSVGQYFGKGILVKVATVICGYNDTFLTGLNCSRTKTSRNLSLQILSGAKIFLNRGVKKFRPTDSA